MRRFGVALALLLVAATPALGDDTTKKHQIDSRISTLQGRISSHQKQEQALRGEVAGYTSRIRALEARVGDVSLRLATLQADLDLHQKRLDALNDLLGLQTEQFVFLQAQYRKAESVLGRRLVDIYESNQASTLDIFLGSRNIDEALDQIEYLNDIGVQDKRIANEVSYAKAQVRAARTKTKKIRATVHSETAVIDARTSQAREVRDELVGARNDLADTKQQKLTDLSQLSAQDRADAQEIDSLQAASAALGDRIRSAQAGSTTTPSASGMIWPVAGPVTSPFGWRWGRMHEGIDIGVAYGTPIHAAASGTIIYCGWESGYGNLTVIDHGGNLATAYGHQSSIAVSCGQHVNQGDVIGYVGSTGHSTGPHLHFEVRVDGNPVDPLGYL
jgi:murein DD-endopeptidase MepM/ murein hydrolase activator NlpD